MHQVIKNLSLLALSFALITGCAGTEGPAGPSGSDGTNGTNGANGSNGTAGTNATACTTTAYDGGVTVSCPNSAPVNVPNGTNGQACTVSDIDGGVIVSCPGSSPVTVLNGNNGNNGNNGTIGLGLSTGLKVTVTSVTSTNPISVRFRLTDDRDYPVDLKGRYSLNTPFVPRFSLSYIPTTGVGVVLAYKVYTKSGSATAASATDAAPDPATVVTSPTALTPTFPVPTSGLPATDALMKGLLVENGAGNGDYTYTFPTGGNTQIKNSSNRFVTTVVPAVSYDPTKLGSTHTLWMQAARQTDLVNPNTVQGFTPVDTEYNFVPNGVGVAIKREVVTTAACSKCHNGFKRDLNPNLTLPTVNGFHGGGRVESPFCNVCHNPDRPNQAANSSVFVHRIHGASKLVANPDGGVPVDAFNGIQVAYPQDIRNCDTCHANAQQGSQAYSRPSIAACGSCHNGVDFAANSPLPFCSNPSAVGADGRFISCKHRGGAQADTACANCHGDAASLSPIKGSHLAVVGPDPRASQLLPLGGYGLPDGGAANNNTHAAWMAAAGAVPFGAYVTTYEIKSAQLSASVTNPDGGAALSHPQVVFKLKQSLAGAVPVDVDFGTYVAGTNTELIPGFVGGPSAYFAFSVPQDGIAAPADFNVVAGCYLKNAWNGTAVTGTSACTISAKDSLGYYTVELTNVNIPVSAQMLTAGLGYSYGIASTRPLTQVNLTAYPYNASTGIGGLIVAAPNVTRVATNYTARRPIVETARCNACHVALGVGPSFHAGQRNDAATCTFCHTPNRTSSAWSANSKDMIHGIHGGRVRTVAFNWKALSPTEDFSEIEFPSNVNNCKACHAPGTYDFTLPSTVAAFPNMLLSTSATGRFNRDPIANPATWFAISPYVLADGVQDYGAGFSFNVTTQVATPAAATTLVKTPITAVCSSCHDAPATIAHMEGMGGAFYKPRSSVVGTYEQCLICHGPGTIAPIELMHK